MIDSIIFSIVETKLDVVFATSVASCFAKNLGYQHIKTIKTILQYLKGSRDKDIIYDIQDKFFIEEYLDFDWAGNKESRKLALNFIFMLNEGPVS